MAAKLRHRGPDEEGSFLSPDGRCAIGFRRLSVIDPVSSHQPMTLPDKSLTVAFNGEIYNFRSLRERLAADGAAFRTDGDTEVLLHLFGRYGSGMVEHLSGMFALVLYDASTGQLLLARDRLGQKPLWYADLGNRLIFCSEAKGLLCHPELSRQIDTSSITYYLAMGYMPSPHTAWQGVRKLPPAHTLRAHGRCGQPEKYWAPQHYCQNISTAELVEAVRHEATRAVEQRLVSDVPLGALLSGGVDSSIIVALMAQAGGVGVKTFTAGFDEAEYDERQAARRVAQHLRTEHTELLVTAAPEGAVDGIVEMYDEPFADSSALPTFLICQAAQQHVTVALTGDGGDEVFGGYDRYRALRLAQTMKPARYMAVRLAAALIRPWAGHHERSRSRRLLRFVAALPHPFAMQYFMYRQLFGPQDLTRLVTDEFAASVDLADPAEWFCKLYEDGEFDEEVARAQRHDLMTYLPDDLLVKADIASMATSLELRSPMLDHGLVSLGLSLPVEMKISGRRGKAVLQRAFCDLLPREVFERPKRGFAVPLSRWLRCELRESLRETLMDGAFLGREILRAESLAGLINDHVSGRADHCHRLWALLVLARWLARQD